MIALVYVSGWNNPFRVKTGDVKEMVEKLNHASPIIEVHTIEDGVVYINVAQITAIQAEKPE